MEIPKNKNSFNSTVPPNALHNHDGIQQDGLQPTTKKSSVQKFRGFFLLILATVAIKVGGLLCVATLGFGIIIGLPLVVLALFLIGCTIKRFKTSRKQISKIQKILFYTLLLYVCISLLSLIGLVCLMFIGNGQCFTLAPCYEPIKSISNIFFFIMLWL